MGDGHIVAVHFAVSVPYGKTVAKMTVAEVVILFLHRIRTFVACADQRIGAVIVGGQIGKRLLHQVIMPVKVCGVIQHALHSCEYLPHGLLVIKLRSNGFRRRVKVLALLVGARHFLR